MALVTSFIEVFLFAGAIYLALLWLRGRKKMDPRFPPGPPQLPFIGNIHQIGKTPQQQFMKWADEFGAAYSINLAGEKFIHLNDPKLIKEVFSDPRAVGRTTHPVFIAFAQGNYGLIMAEGQHWQEQRRFSLRTLRDLGFAKTSMEELIMDEGMHCGVSGGFYSPFKYMKNVNGISPVYRYMKLPRCHNTNEDNKVLQPVLVNAMLKWFEKRQDQPIRGDRIFNGPVVNALWRIMSGERSEWDVPKKPKLIEGTEAVIRGFNTLVDTGIMFFPSLRYLAPGKLGWNDYTKAVSDLVDTCKESTDKHKLKLDPDNPGDLIDQYLIEMNKSKDPTSSFYKETGEKNLGALISDLFLAGSETTLLLLAHHPQIQKKLQDELDAVLGRDRQPSLADKPNLPYVEAIMMEILRRTSLSLNGVPHRLSEDAVIGGYFFPKGISVMGNIYRIHHDPKIWGDPKNFRPERFLSQDGKSVVRHEALQPFSVGKRLCIGKTLAEDTLFLFIASIFQKFAVYPDPDGKGEEMNTIDPGAKLLNEVEPFKVIVKLREKN